MIISDVALKQVRSHEDEKFVFKKGVNIIIGPNGGGKTNLLEALYLICTGSTFRPRDKTLVQYDKNQALIKSIINNETRVLKLTYNQNKSPIKEFTINSQKTSRLPQDKKIPICLFEPNHLQVIYNGPDLRRNIIDQSLSQVFPHYSKILNNYKRALIQRNNLLKQERQILDDELFIWNVHLSEFGSKIINYRTKWINYLNNKVSEIYSDISDTKSNMQIIYQNKSNKEDYGSWLLSKLQETNKRDQAIGFTTNGPHRDDITFVLNGQAADQTASRGEIRSLMLAYKLLELEFLEKTFQHKPLIMFDDVFSELDETRQQKLLGTIRDYQSFITTTHTSSSIRQQTNILTIGLP